MNRRMWVVLFDVVKSSKVANREQLLARVQAAVNEHNRLYRGKLFAPLEVMRGDEVATVLESPESLYPLTRDFLLALHPYVVRTAIARGEITAGVATHRTSLMDGPAFYTADELMRRMKRSQRVVSLWTGSGELDVVLNGLFNALLWDWLDLTPFQRQVTRLYLQGRSQSEIAGTVRRTQQQVSRALQSARWEVIQIAERGLTILMKRASEPAVEAEIR